MRAVLIEEDTKDLYIGSVEDPECGDMEILVSVKATALNRADLLQRVGNYPPPPGASEVLGLEMAGVIEKVGSNVDSWNVGDRVFALLPGGGYAEKVVIPSQMAMKIPDELSFKEAAAMPEAFLTAYLNLVMLGKLEKKEYVLIHAGASGVGTAAIQIARELGAIPIVTAGSDEKLSYCKKLGAMHCINYKETGDFSNKILEITQQQGVSLILDFVGGTYWNYNMASISKDGRWILVGSLGGREVKNVNLGEFLTKRIKFIGSTLRGLPIQRKKQLTRHFENFALEKISTGKIKPVIDKVYSWKDVEKAHQRMKNNINIGKIVLDIH